MALQVLGKVAQEPPRPDSRGPQGIAARGKPTYMGNNNAPGAGRPRGPRLQFDVETLQRRLMENAAATRTIPF